MSERIPVQNSALTHDVRGSEETVLYDESGNQLLVLNETGAAIWLLLDGRRTTREITELVVELLDADTHQVDEDIARFLDELHSKDLISWK